jgi:LPXTG-motif cell wall-anchored protein
VPHSTDGTIVKKFTCVVLGIFIFIVSGSVLSGAIELHHVIAGGIQRFDSFPESGWLIVIGTLLISGATFLRRRRAARTR